MIKRLAVITRLHTYSCYFSKNASADNSEENMKANGKDSVFEV